MRILSLFRAVPLVVWAQMAVSGDMALILGEVGQLAKLRNDTSVISSDFAGPLRAAGFEIIQPKNRSSGNMRLAVQRVEAALEKGGLERLVVVVTGPLASSGRESWALSNGAAGASSLNVGMTGISISALTDIALAAKGRAAILIAPGKDIGTLGNGLVPGLSGPRPAGEVTFVIGPAEALVIVLTDGLLDPAKSFSEVAAGAPDAVEFRGDLSDRFGLMGEIVQSD